MSLDIHPEYQPTRKPKITIIALVIWLGIVAAMVMVIAGLSGCSTPTTFDGICALQPVGMTDGGIAVARVHCEVS